MKNYTARGKCPACTIDYDLNHAKPTICEEIKGSTVMLLYALCPSCKIEFDLSKDTERLELVRTCFKNVKQCDDAFKYAVTSSIAMVANGWNFYQAWENGIDIPRHLFDAIEAGTVDAYTILSSVVSGASHGY